MAYVGCIFQGSYPATTDGDSAPEEDHTAMKTAEENHTATKTSVWWDIENCEVPKGCDALKIAQNIRSALIEKDYCGSVSIYAYGDTNQIPSSVQQALSSTGVTLIHVPPGVKDGSDKKILVDMMLWAMENEAPANIMLISADGDFSYALHRLGMKRYNILLARPEKASEALIVSAKTVWLWPNLATGDRLYRPIYSVPDHPNKGTDQDLECERDKRRSYCILCKVSCASHDLSFHLAGRKHRTNAWMVERARREASESVWCRVCQTGFKSKESYENHIFERHYQYELRDQAEHSRKRPHISPNSPSY